MINFDRYFKPNRKDFEVDPFGYSALARYKWGLAQEVSGFPVDISKPATTEELKNPILWLTQANALSEAAIAIFKNQPSFENMPPLTRGICDSQYCAAGLMMLGYSLEICLKAMITINEGIDSYLESEKNHKHHRLHELAKFIPNLSKKEKAGLRLLSHFVYWAGRYPDPGYGKQHEAEDIFTLSEKHQITAKELFTLATKVMGYAQTVTES
jgi:hypothetical protein